jgi:alpha-L-fucosidase
MRLKTIPIETYKTEVVKKFNPAAFDAAEWVQRAKAAGMKYMVVTAKHHDGFAMWHSDAYKPKPNYPSYDTASPTYDMRMTPFNTRDPMAELRDAARAAGLKFGIYYSHAFDWEHPYAPGNDWDDFTGVNGFSAGRNPGGDDLFGGRDWWMDGTYKAFLEKVETYMTEKSIPQILELVEKYDPDIMWFDTHHNLPLYQNIRVAKLLREKKVDVVINGRLARTGAFQLGDYVNSGDRSAYMFPQTAKYWESIPTTNESYGYSSTDNSHKTPTHFIRLLAAAASKGGNILMNVGPMGSGKWDPKDIAIFSAIGKWLDVNGESIYGTVRTNDIPIPNWGVITKKDNQLYLHVHQWPKDGKLWLGSLAADVTEAKTLTTGQVVTWEQKDKDMLITAPGACPDTASTVIRLTLADGYESYPQRLLDAAEKNILYTFDAALTVPKNGPAFSNGDGKPGNNYLSGWTSSNQYMTWNVRAREAATYSVEIAFTDSARNGTVYIEAGGKEYEVSQGSSPLFVANIPLSRGEHVIRLRGKNNAGDAEFMRPISVTLNPAP